ncbi:MAG TPA: universal stress protein [Candidatus Acidoferrales bacterium]|nr:universal stress protein [Candidatus Acidoferrales bacterium]
MAIKRILIPVDFSDDSLNALAYARDFALASAAELVVLHVIEPVYYASPTDLYATSPNLALLLDEQRKAGKAELERIAADLQKKHHRVRTLLKTGSPAQVIVDTAKSIKADLVVVSTHGRTGFAHIVMGSVAEKVVRGAGCPVLTVRRALLKAGKKSGRKKR